MPSLSNDQHQWSSQSLIPIIQQRHLTNIYMSSFIELLKNNFVDSSVNKVNPDTRGQSKNHLTVCAGFTLSKQFLL